MGIAQGAAIVAGLTVADVVVGVDHEAGCVEGTDHVQVAAGVFTVAMDELDDAAGLTEGGIGPGLDGVAAVGRGETEFANGHGCSSFDQLFSLF